jgi:hypothetical protein
MTTPASLLEVVEVIGEPAALKLVQQYGGTTPRLPALRNITPEHPLAQCIGIDVLNKLVATLGGARWMYVPRCAKGLRDARDREIVTLASPPHNIPVQQLALRFGLSDRQIWNILGKITLDDKQTSLF